MNPVLGKHSQEKIRQSIHSREEDSPLLFPKFDRFPLFFIDTIFSFNQKSTFFITPGILSYPAIPRPGAGMIRTWLLGLSYIVIQYIT